MNNIALTAAFIHDTITHYRW